MTHQVLADAAVSMAELGREPARAMAAGGGRPVAVIDHDKATHYIVPAALYERMLDVIDDVQLRRVFEERRGDVPVPVDIDTV